MAYERSEGARWERKAIRAFLRRQIKKALRGDLGTVVSPDLPFENVLSWVLDRQRRYDKQKGGL